MEKYINKLRTPMDRFINKLDTTEKRIRVGREVWKYPEWTTKEKVNGKHTNEPKKNVSEKRDTLRKSNKLVTELSKEERKWN